MEMFERLHFDNYSLRKFWSNRNWKMAPMQSRIGSKRLDEQQSNKLLARVIHEKKFAPVFAQIRQATQAEAIAEILRSVKRASSEGE